jgi:uncharacterized protein (TIGR03083 family)
MDRHLAVLRHEAEALAAAARLGLGAPVPSCPGWDVAALTAHTGKAYRWAARIVSTHADAEVPEDVVGAPPADGLVEWYEESLAELVETITNEGADSPCWNWSEQDLRAAFWARRMANETAVHRWDAQLAHGAPQPIDADVAVDGVDELVSVFLAKGLAQRGTEATGLALVEASDTGDVWSVRVLPDTAEVTRERPDAPDATLRATASDLLLALWGRDVPYDAEGDPALLRLITE